MKKKKGKAPIIIAVVVVVVILGFFASMGAEDPTPSTGEDQPPSVSEPDTPAVTKEDSEAADLAIAQAVWSSREYYENVSARIGGLGTGETTADDLYAYCSEAKDFLRDFSGRVDDVDTAGAEEYKEAAGGYIAVVRDLVDRTMKYLEKPDDSTLSEIQADVAAIPTAEAMVTEARNEYLTGAGLTEEEIASRPAMFE